MEKMNQKRTTLFRLFFRKLILFALLVLVEIAFFIVLFSVGLNQGFILPANNLEQVLEKRKEQIATSQPFDESLIPFACEYGIFDQENNYIQGTFGETEKKEAIQQLTGEEKLGKLYMSIERKDGICVIKYDIKAHFASKSLHQIFPTPEYLFAFLFILVFLGILIYSASNLGKRLKTELNPLLKEVEKIQKKELDLTQEATKIKEFHEVLQSIQEMKIALTDSLTSEWKTEQTRKSHISSLAHDIRTPLTIMKGNAELISEDTKDSEMKANADTIIKNTEKIERYIKLLIEATKQDSFLESEPQEIKLQELIGGIAEEAKNFCKAESINLIPSGCNLTETVFLDQELVTRAILNIIKNAVEHSSSGSNVYFSCDMIEDDIMMTIEDFGTGFSREALKYAKEQFFTDKKERANENYGLGLHSAEAVAKLYGGRIEFYNKEDTEGAVVIFKMKREYSSLISN